MCDQCEYNGPTSESLRLHFKVSVSTTDPLLRVSGSISRSVRVQRTHFRESQAPLQGQCGTTAPLQRVSDSTSRSVCVQRTHFRESQTALQGQCGTTALLQRVLGSTSRSVWAHRLYFRESQTPLQDQCEYNGPTSESLRLHFKVSVSTTALLQRVLGSTSRSVWVQRPYFRESQTPLQGQCEYNGPTSESLRLHFKVSVSTTDLLQRVSDSTSRSVWVQRTYFRESQAPLQGQCEYNGPTSESLRLHFKVSVSTTALLQRVSDSTSRSVWVQRPYFRESQAQLQGLYCL